MVAASACERGVTQQGVQIKCLCVWFEKVLRTADGEEKANVFCAFVQKCLSSLPVTLGKEREEVLKQIRGESVHTRSVLSHILVFVHLIAVYLSVYFEVH